MNQSLSRRCKRASITHRRGLTLMEVIVSTFLIATVMVVSLTASANLLRNRVEQQNWIAGNDLAREMLDEVTAMEFRDPDGGANFGLEADETAADRMTYDDLDDYHNYVSTPPTRRDSAAIANYTGWSVSVSVQPADPIAAGVNVTTNFLSPLRLVTVVCTAPDGSSASQSMVISDVPTDVPSDASYERWQQTTFSFPGEGEISVTTPLRNLPLTTP